MHEEMEQLRAMLEGRNSQLAVAVYSLSGRSP